MGKVEIKTKATKASVTDYLNSIQDADRKKDCKKLHQLMKKVSGTRAQMWGTSIVGYGKTTYYRSNGDEGEWFPIGWSSRIAAITVYATCNLEPYRNLLSKLGKHKSGKGCIYIKKLDGVDLGVLEKLLKHAYSSKK